MPAKILIAGATGYTGHALMPLLKDFQVTAWLREDSPDFARKKQWLESYDADVISSPLSDASKLASKLKGISWMISLLGTTRAQFNASTSYESVDYALNRDLIGIARACGIPNFLLLSSIGAGNPTGAYLKVKKRAEDALIASGLRYTILRPSFITGAGRRAAQLLTPLFCALKWIAPGMSATYQPMSADTLARVIERVIAGPQSKNQILEGQALWRLAMS